jgi:hypothetical protein
MRARRDDALAADDRSRLFLVAYTTRILRPELAYCLVSTSTIFPSWAEHFQARPLSTWDGSLRGTFHHASAFDYWSGSAVVVRPGSRPLKDPATEGRTPYLRWVGAASARARRPFPYRDSLSCRCADVRMSELFLGSRPAIEGNPR